jgi:hypothetical protein
MLDFFAHADGADVADGQPGGPGMAFQAAATPTMAKQKAEIRKFNRKAEVSHQKLPNPWHHYRQIFRGDA